MQRPSLRTISHLDIRRLSEEASQIPRLRKNLNVHPEMNDPVQRLFNAMEPGTYVRAHRHARENGWELMICLHGSFSVLTFDDHGQVLERTDLDSASHIRAVEIPAHTWHTVVVHDAGTVMFEVKPGPYSPIEDKDFPVWSPRETHENALLAVRWFADAGPGDRPCWLGESRTNSLKLSKI